MRFNKNSYPSIKSTFISNKLLLWPRSLDRSTQCDCIPLLKTISWMTNQCSLHIQGHARRQTQLPLKWTILTFDPFMSTTPLLCNNYTMSTKQKPPIHQQKKGSLVEKKDLVWSTELTRNVFNDYRTIDQKSLELWIFEFVSKRFYFEQKYWIRISLCSPKFMNYCKKFWLNKRQPVSLELIIQKILKRNHIDTDMNYCMALKKPHMLRSIQFRMIYCR